MNVIELVVGQLALQRQLVNDTTLQQCLQVSYGSGGSLGQLLVQRALLSPEGLGRLIEEAQHSHLACSNCGAAFTLAQLDLQNPLGCARCRGPLLVVPPGQTAHWHADPVTHTGSERFRHPPQQPLGSADTRPGSQRFPADRPLDHSKLDPGSQRWQASPSQSIGSASTRFRALVKPGSVVGAYEIMDELGRGGMGVVFKARHVTQGFLVAFKVLLAGALASERQQKRFQREAEALARLEHPNIVTVFDMGKVGEHMYFTMEFVEGQNLGELIKGKRLSVRRAAEIARDIAHGLQHAHEKGILHRDIKPDNILVDGSGAPRITDFGLVRDMDSEQNRLTKSGAVLGTPYYMSPEQATGKRSKVAGATDVYALGVVLYQALTGQVPYEAATQLELTKKILEGNASLPSTVSPRIGTQLDAVVMKAMAMRPEDRYDTAGDMAEDLDRFLRGEEVLARPKLPGPPVPLKWVGVGGAVLVGVIAVTAFLSSGGGSGPPPAPTTPTSTPTPGASSDELTAALEKVKSAEGVTHRASTETYHDALEKLEQALDIAREHAPHDPVLAVKRGRVRQRRHRMEEALVDFADARKQAPASSAAAEATYLTVRLLQRTKDEAELVDMIKEGLTAAGADASPWKEMLGVLSGWVGVDEPDQEALVEEVSQLRVGHAGIPELIGLEAYLLDASDSDRALRCYQDALLIDPKNASFWAARAGHYVNTGKLERAKEDVDRALQLDPRLGSALEVRGVIRAKSGDLSGAEIDFERALEENPKGINPILILAKISFMGEREIRAAELYGKAEDLFPKHLTVYLDQAEVYTSVGKFDRALNALKRGLDAVEGDARKSRRLWRRFAELAIATREYELARRVCRERLSRNGKDADALELLGDTHAQSMEGLTDGVEWWDQALEANPRQFSAWEKKIRVLFTLEKLDETEIEIQKFAAAGPNDPIVTAYMVQYYLEKKRPTEARKIAEEAVRNTPKAWESWYSLGLMNMIEERPREALEAIKRSVMIRPEYGEAQHLLAQAYMEIGDTSRALHHWQEAIRYDPFLSKSVTRLADHAYETGKFKLAYQISAQHMMLMETVKRQPSEQFLVRFVTYLLSAERRAPADQLADQLLQIGIKSQNNRCYLAEALMRLGRTDEARTLVDSVLTENPRHRRALSLQTRLGG